ncbi:Putative membrane peptidase YdiL protein [Haloplasma contractile SSD-17B]|uniref:Membrane peptidase YdiL protein n=2 Tax=Haloplasma TaxID=471824 RepID=U2DYY8_9MOLU|nr:Putative membrane peptidase YdiL protein [Haloplasma contractile SSD-17B]
MIILGIIMTYVFGICESSVNQQAIQDSLAYPLLIIPPVVLIAPIVEETFFRGILFKYMTKIPLPKVVSVILAFAVSSFLFGFIHIIGEIFAGNFGEFVQILPYMGLGLILALVYYITDNIIVPIIMHIIQNSFSIIMSYLLLLLPELPEDTANTCELMVRAFVSLFS